MGKIAKVTLSVSVPEEDMMRNVYDKVYQSMSGIGYTVLACTCEQKDEDSVSIVWSVEDVLQVRPDLSQEQAKKVLTEAKENHDATMGINWGTLSYVAEVLYGEAPENKEE